jgi:hypothetical protein
LNPKLTIRLSAGQDYDSGKLTGALHVIEPKNQKESCKRIVENRLE